MRARRPIAGFFLVLIFVTTNLTSDDLVGRAVADWSNRYRVMTFGLVSLLMFFAIYVDRRVRKEGGQPHLA